MANGDDKNNGYTQTQEEPVELSKEQYENLQNLEEDRRQLIQEMKEARKTDFENVEQGVIRNDWVVENKPQYIETIEEMKGVIDGIEKETGKEMPDMTKLLGGVTEGKTTPLSQQNVGTRHFDFKLDLSSPTEKGPRKIEGIKGAVRGLDVPHDEEDTDYDFNSDAFRIARMQRNGVYSNVPTVWREHEVTVEGSQEDYLRTRDFKNGGTRKLKRQKGDKSFSKREAQSWARKNLKLVWLDSNGDIVNMNDPDTKEKVHDNEIKIKGMRYALREKYRKDDRPLKEIDRYDWLTPKDQKQFTRAGGFSGEEDKHIGEVLNRLNETMDLSGITPEEVEGEVDRSFQMDFVGLESEKKGKGKDDKITSGEEGQERYKEEEADITGETAKKEKDKEKTKKKTKVEPEKRTEVPKGNSKK